MSDTSKTLKKGFNNFSRWFEKILNGAALNEGEFHDLRRTAISRWFANGLSEYDVMHLAGHSDFQTTHRFYLAVRDDLVQRARLASAVAMGHDFGTRLARASISEQKEKSCQPQVLDSQQLNNYPRCDSNAQPLASEAFSRRVNPCISRCYIALLGLK